MLGIGRTIGAAAALGAALALAGCGGGAEPESAAREQTQTLSAVVQSVDQETRQVLLRDDRGEILEFVAGPEVRNLPQLEPGDLVRIEYFEAVAARLAEPGDLDEPIVVGAMGRAPEGQKPGGFIAASEEMIVEFVSYDSARQIVTILGPSGEPTALPLRDPQMQAFAARRRAGDRVHVTITESLAVAIVEN